jgi:hypothetical protein
MGEEIIVRTDGGTVVARMNFAHTGLDGHCEWFDLGGNLVAYGQFKDGAPYTGTFLAWNRHFCHLFTSAPYDRETYCRDWITLFEAGFDSEPPAYDQVVEAYCKGRAI